MGLSLAQASSMDLSQDYNFTGTVTGMGTAGAMTLIKTLTASSSSSLSFVNGSNDVVLDSNYKAYKFVFKNIHPATDSTHFEFNMSTDSGSNYNVTKTSTSFYAYHTEGDTEANSGYTTAQDLAQSTSYQRLTPDSGNDADQVSSGELWIYNPSSTTYVKHFMSRANSSHQADYSMDWYIAGYGNTTSAINAIRFQMSSGNIDDGTIIMYGIA